MGGDPPRAFLLELGAHEPGHHERHVDARMRAREVDARVGGQRVEGRLGRVVGGPERHDRHPAEHRGDVEDVSAAARDEVRHDRLHPVERRFHVDRHHQVELLVGELENRPIDTPAGVVDPDVHVAECLNRAIAQSLDLVPLRGVGRHDHRTGAQLRRNHLELSLAPRRQHYAVSAGGKLHGELGADPAARAGDHNVFRICHR